mgnify:CR=1 FL=1
MTWLRQPSQDDENPSYSSGSERSYTPERPSTPEATNRTDSVVRKKAAGKKTAKKVARKGKPTLTDVVKKLHDHGIGVQGCFVFGLDSDFLPGKIPPV